MGAWSGIFKIKQGTTWVRKITIKGADYSTYQGRMFWKRSKDKESPDVTLTTENGAITIQAVLNGGVTDTVITLSQTATQTADHSGTYYFDLELYKDAIVTRPIEGSIIVDREVTK